MNFIVLSQIAKATIFPEDLPMLKSRPVELWCEQWQSDEISGEHVQNVELWGWSPQRGFVDLSRNVGVSRYQRGAEGLKTLEYFHGDNARDFLRGFQYLFQKTDIKSLFPVQGREVWVEVREINLFWL